MALKSAHKALTLVDEDAKINGPLERDYIRAYWLIGASYRALASTGSASEPENLENAEKHLGEALRRCRAINAVMHESDILLEISKLRFIQGKREEALRLAEEALTITERSGYVLQGADVHLFLAELALKGIGLSSKLQGARGKLQVAREYAEKALKLATCDGAPNYYKIAYQEAEAFLAELDKR